MSISFQAARKRLPEGFLTRLADSYSQPLQEKILRGLMQPRLTSLRINTLKTDVQEILAYLRQSAVQFERVTGMEEALVLKNRREDWVENWEAYQSGKIYLQGLSSQIPALFLMPEPGENILDMTAAPGSKTTQIAAMMKNEGRILANDLNAIRAERMQFNLRRQGVSIATVRVSDARSLWSDYFEEFDRVLLDAPCSAEGRIQVDQGRTFKFWSEKNIREHARLQRRLLQTAVRVLKPGGRLVYSTCTLAVEENEVMVDWFLQMFPFMEPQSVSFDFMHRLPVTLRHLDRSLDPRCGLALKAAPSITSEGFFIIAFKKAGSMHREEQCVDLPQSPDDKMA